MSDPRIREIGRIEDSQGRILIVGVDYDAVTLGLGGGGTLELGGSQVEELAQLIVSATWQAAAQTGADIGELPDHNGPGWGVP